ncbi:hypothetical protein EB796_005707 [Bugula neritina]|uniref:Uncharacterized protein n=1 Tax=Bugula neritina TaxID=10212 RepID=A0A7J7KBH1_BUGNE|nr:hypothetical protein EB796_005707 [Bugula neritina]
MKHRLRTATAFPTNHGPNYHLIHTLSPADTTKPRLLPFQTCQPAECLRCADLEAEILVFTATAGSTRHRACSEEVVSLNYEAQVRGGVLTYK